jgi:hypothetical protein
LPSVAEQLAQAIAGSPCGIWLVLDEVAVDEVRGLGFELLEAQRAGIEWIAGEVCGELIGNVVVDQRLVALFGTGGVGVADDLELTGPGGVVVELELYSGGVDGGGGGQPVGVDTDLGVVGAEGDDVGWGVVEVEKAGSDFVSGGEEVRSAGSQRDLRMEYMSSRLA